MSLVSFEISPSEFEEVLTRYPYEKIDYPDGVSIPLLNSLAKQEDCPVDYPREPMVVEYRYSFPGSDEHSQVSIYTNTSRSVVYVICSDG